MVKTLKVIKQSCFFLLEILNRIDFLENCSLRSRPKSMPKIGNLAPNLTQVSLTDIEKIFYTVDLGPKTSYVGSVHDETPHRQ